MIRRIYIFFLLLALIILPVSCEKQKAPDFDRSASDLLIDVCEAIIKGQDEEALEILSQLRHYPDTASFVEEAELDVRRHRNSKHINTLLNAGDFQELKQFIVQNESTGASSTEMLIKGDMADALQALTLFCAKMPWENSESLQNALNILTPYQDILNQTKSFPKFFAEQQNTLQTLKLKELQAKIDDALQQLELSAFNNDQANWAMAMSDLKKLRQSALPYKLDEQRLQSATTVMNWSKLTQKQRQDALRNSNYNENTLCGNILKTMQEKSLTALYFHIQAMKDRDLPPSPLAVMYCVQNLHYTKNTNYKGTMPNCIGLYPLFTLAASTTIPAE